MISACADLAVRLVHGGDEKSSGGSGKNSHNFLSGWISSCKKEAQETSVVGDSKTLVLVGYVTTLRTMFKYLIYHQNVFHRQRTYRKR